MKRINSALLLMSLVIPFLAQAQRRPTNIVSPDIQADHSVIFRIKAPEANAVQLTGTWPKAIGNVIPMVKKDSVFEVKIGPLPSDMYEYEFVCT